MKKGFTLIEMIVVVAIISLFFGLSLAYYNEYSDLKELDNAVQQIDDVLHLAQKKAIAGDIETACNNFTGYEVRCTASNQYDLYFCCNDACTSKLASYVLDSSLTLTCSKASIYFKPLSGRLNSLTDITVQIAFTPSKYSIFTITPAGLISKTH